MSIFPGEILLSRITCYLCSYLNLTAKRRGLYLALSRFVSSMIVWRVPPFLYHGRRGCESTSVVFPFVLHNRRLTTNDRLSETWIKTTYVEKRYYMTLMVCLVGFAGRSCPYVCFSDENRHSIRSLSPYPCIVFKYDFPAIMSTRYIAFSTLETCVTEQAIPLLRFFFFTST